MWNRETTQDEAARPTQISVPVPAPVPAPAIPGRPVDERRVVAWVGKSVLFRGDLIGLEDMVIDGRVEGTIELRENKLTVGPDAHIQADIVAKVVTVLGAVVGTITATEAVDIRETGSVEGNITTRRLAMADGAVVRGQIDTGTSRAADRQDQEPRSHRARQ
jgi:cytoskeletal protein CcmA (bactofilin family)